MAETGPAIALLFGDSELGGHLREALQEHGARIVHEGSIAGFNRQALHDVGADVIVVNLDDDDDASLDHLHEVIDTDTLPVVFNDAQVSRALGGWDRARWARHLAVKVMASGNVDPPRPADAPAVRSAEPAVAPPADDVETLDAVAAATVDAVAPEVSVDATGPEPAVDAVAPVLSAEPSIDALATPDAVESESLEAELQAMLASDAPSTGEDDFGSGLRYFEEPPALLDGDFSLPEDAADPAPVDASAVDVADDGLDLAPGQLDAEPPQTFAFDHLPDELAMAPAAPEAPAKPVARVVSAPDSWALVDDDAPAVPAPPAADFGIVKQSAADFLSPDVEDAAPMSEPVMTLELMSMEEAVAPQPYDHEMQLDELGRKLERVVVLGAAADGLASVCEFLAALPARSRLTFLLVQHQGDMALPALVEMLRASGPLAVRPATQGGFANAGEVLVVPAAQQVTLRRDGSVALRDAGMETGHTPSIDSHFSTVATEFGAGVVAIVFGGRSTDAVAGAQAVHDLGGEVWVEASSDEQYSDMVGGIVAERLVSYSGAPRELAAHLSEVFS